MRERYGRLIACMLLMLVAPYAAAGVVALEAGHSDYLVSAHLDWLRDPGHKLGLGSLLQGTVGKWQRSKEPIPNLGYSDDAVWFRVTLDNHDAEEHWYLEIPYPLIRNFSVFVVRDGAVSEVYQTGDRFEFSARPFLHRNFIFPIAIPRQTQVQVFFRISGPYSIQLPVHLLDDRELVRQDAIASMLHGLFFGFVLVMAIYNFFLFLGTRERSYLFYVLFSLSIGMFQFVQQGFAYQLLWPEEIWWQNKATGVFILLSLLSSFLFVTDFLGLRKNMPWLYRALGVIALLALLMLCLVPFVAEFYAVRVGVLLSVPDCLLAILGGWIMWKRGRSDARIFSIAWVFFLVGVLALALNKLALIPRNFLTEHGAELGTVIELSMLALALAGRINHERQQRIALELQTRELERSALLAKERALELERLSNEQLERNVRERTDDLHRALTELSDMNRKLEQLSIQDPVTGVGNENSFLRALKQEWERAFRDGETLALMVVELDGYRNVVADYGLVAAEECLKSVAMILGRTVSRPADVLTRYGDKVFGVLLPATDGAGARYLAQRVADQVREKPFDFGICKIEATISIGIACEQPSRAGNHKELLLLAESAVYVAQNNGGDQIQLAKSGSAN